MNKIKGNPELYIIAELFNREYIEYRMSNPCRIGEVIFHYLEKLRKFQIYDVLNDIRIRIMQKLFKYRYYNPTQRDDIINYNLNKLNNLISKKMVVYSCITGNYDSIQEPLFDFDSVDFIMFSDCPTMISSDSAWKFREIPKKLEEFTNSEKNRYIKLHPFEFFENYDYALYIDGNIKIISHPLFFSLDEVNEKIGIAMHNHHARSCVYKEAAVCKLLKRGNIKKIQLQVDRYKKEGFPKDWGLFEANVIAVDLKDHNANMLMNEWWRELNKSGSGRDQIAFPYVLWKLGYKVSDVSILGNNVTQNPKLRIVSHS